MKKYFFLIIPAIGLILFGFLIVSAQNDDPFSNLTYPIPELGNCKNKADCGKFCDKPENTGACLDFAETHNLIAASEIDLARKVLSSGETGGPGGCRGQQECETYCDIPSNMEECITFGLEHDLIPADERQEAGKALSAIRQGATPPPCRGKAACETYCSQPENIEACLPFAEAAGFISPEEADMIRRTGGQGPGGCRGREDCDAYCQNSDNMEKCINFGLQYGLMPPEEAENAQMALRAIKKGVKMPNCRGKAECDVFCSQPENSETCIDFAAAAGFMSPEEAEQAKKMAKAGIFGGPGGCKGKEECEDYCDNPDNMPECVDFAVKAGMMSPEEAEQAKKMAALGITGGPGGCKGQEECEAFCQDPANGEECINFAVKAGFMTREEADMARQMGSLQAQGGPGGCRGEEECMAYCQDPSHLEECSAFVGETKGGEEFEGPPPGSEGHRPPEGYYPEGEGGEFGRPPTEEEIKATEEQYRQQYESEEYRRRQEEEYRRQMEQNSPPGAGSEYEPPPEGAPQSLLKTVKNFLATIISVFQIKY